MSSYTVTSDRLVGHDKGDTVTDKDLAGANIAALVKAGHLKAAPKPKATTTKGSK